MCFHTWTDDSVFPRLQAGSWPLFALLGLWAILCDTLQPTHCKTLSALCHMYWPVWLPEPGTSMFFFNRCTRKCKNAVTYHPAFSTGSGFSCGPAVGQIFSEVKNIWRLCGAQQPSQQDEPLYGLLSCAHIYRGALGSSVEIISLCGKKLTIV